MKITLKPNVKKLTIILVTSLTTFAAQGQTSSNENSSLLKVYAPVLPKSINFAGERVPLERFEVRERLDRDIITNTYMQGSMIYIMKLAQRYFPIIEERLKANGVPDDFKYLAVAESSLQHLVSSAGARSFWQFLGPTAQSYGLEVNDNVDERYHVIKATNAACKYLTDAKNKFGTWTAAAASYNCGMGGYNGNATSQGSFNYYDLLLPEETNRYIFRILAIKHIMANAKQMGYMLTEADKYNPIKTRIITVTSTISDLNKWAQDNGSSYKMVKLANPWLRSKTLPVKPGKIYEIEIPLANQ